MRKSKKAKRKPAHIRAVEAQRKRAERERGKVHDALQHLGMIRQGVHITELYAKFFPEEFAKDAPDYGDPWKLLAFYDRFARLVDQKLFPLYPFSETDMAYEEPEYYFHNIPLEFMENWLWVNQEAAYRYYGGHGAHLHIVEKLVVSASDEKQVFDDVDFRLPARHKFRLPRLHKACREQKGMIGRLGLVADAILGNTNNCWLDITEEEYHSCEMPTWSEEQVKFLTREWAEAQFLNKGIKEFFDWCDSANKVERVKRLLRLAWIRKEDEERIRVRALLRERPGRPLVETLGLGGVL
jgi:hypothetical protein